MVQSQVMQYVGRLEEKLTAEGSMKVDAVKQWLVEEGLPPQRTGFVMGQGAKQGAHKWYREGDTMFPGPRPGTPPRTPPVHFRSTHGAADIPTVDEAMDQPTAQSRFQALMQSIGVDESQAKMAANFCFNAFDMDKPGEVWQALRECPQVGQPVIKKQLWRLWTRNLEVEIPDTLVQQVNTWGQPQAAQASHAARKFFAIDGKVVPTTPEDPEGMSMTDAVRLASYQRTDNPKEEQTSGGVIATMIQQQGETERKRMEIEAQKSQRPEREGDSVAAAAIHEQGELVRSILNKPPDTSLEGRMDSQRREFDAKMEARDQRFLDFMERTQENNKSMLEMVQTENRHTMELLRLTMEGNNSRPSIITEIEEVLASGLIEKLRPQPAASPMIAGPDGKGMMTLDVYKAINEMEFKREAITLAKETLPKVIEMGFDAAEATRRLAA